MKIDKNVPMPNVKHNSHGKWKAIAERMEIGDSLGGLSHSEALGLSQALRNIHRRPSYRQQRRRLRGEHGAEGKGVNMTDAIEKLIILVLMLRAEIDNWREYIWSRDLDAPICCDGRECSCGAETVRESWKSYRYAPRKRGKHD